MIWAAVAKIIVLNGVSSAGKTTLAKAIQARSSRPVLRVAMDTFLEMMPARFANHAQAFAFDAVAEVDPPETSVMTGPFGTALMQGMRRSVAALADEGLDLVVDDVMLDPGDEADYRHALAAHELRFVAVRCTIETAEARERARGDRYIGQARWQYSRVHKGVSYDLEIETDHATAEQLAPKVIETFGL